MEQPQVKVYINGKEIPPTEYTIKDIYVFTADGKQSTFPINDD